MNNNKRLTEHQSGNKKLHSCETHIVMTTDKVLEAMDSKKLTLVVLLDLSKAFESIGHCWLLSNLTTLEWFRSCLTGRQQYVRIGSETSSLGPISHGVSQDSTLGPALFKLNINDLPTVPESGSLESIVDMILVDDSKLSCSRLMKTWLSSLSGVVIKFSLSTLIILNSWGDGKSPDAAKTPQRFSCHLTR